MSEEKEFQESLKLLRKWKANKGSGKRLFHHQKHSKCGNRSEVQEWLWEARRLEHIGRETEFLLRGEGGGTRERTAASPQCDEGPGGHGRRGEQERVTVGEEPVC